MVQRFVILSASFLENSVANKKISVNEKNAALDGIVFENLFNELYVPLCRYCIQFIRIPEIAEEIVQEQFVYIWEKRFDIHIHTSLKSYLYASVRNKSIDYLKSKFARINFVNEQSSYELIETLNPLNIIEETELSSIMTIAIESLPEKCHIIFTMSRFGDLTNKQIAQELELSEKTIEAQITIAIKKIKSFVEKYYVLV